MTPKRRKSTNRRKKTFPDRVMQYVQAGLNMNQRVIWEVVNSTWSSHRWHVVYLPRHILLSSLVQESMLGCTQDISVRSRHKLQQPLMDEHLCIHSLGKTEWEVSVSMGLVSRNFILWENERCQCEHCRLLTFNDMVSLIYHYTFHRETKV